jgi:hypothetical protein
MSREPTISEVDLKKAKATIKEKFPNFNIENLEAVLHQDCQTH